MSVDKLKRAEIEILPLVSSKIKGLRLNLTLSKLLKKNSSSKLEQSNVSN
jgi:hypothetical protein